MKLIIGIAGASGVIYGIRLLEILQKNHDVETHLILTNTGRMNIKIETKYSASYVESLADKAHKNSNVGASIASGSFKVDGMIVTACAMKTLSSIVHSHADDLLTRAADVTLKERRPLVLMPRETPLHQGHCKLLYEASKLGAIIAPPMPAFYGKQETIDDLINHSVGRILDLFNIESDLINRWAGA
jgi:4-hydroxy-3-polyprenylbenzoate decarboxylase